MQHALRAIQNRNIDQIIRHIVDMLRIMWDCAAKWLIAAVVLVVAQSFFPLAALYVTKLVFDQVSAYFTADATLVLSDILGYVALLGVMVLLSNLSRLLLDFVFDTMTQIVTDHIYDLLHHKAIEIDLEFFENRDYFDMMYRAQEEVAHRPTELIQALLSLVKNGLSLLGIMLLLVSLYSNLVVILIVASLPGFIARIWYSSRLYRWKRDVASKERQAWYYSGMITGRQHAKEIRLFGLGSYFAKTSDDLRGNLRRHRIRLDSQYYLAEFSAQLSGTIALIMAFVMIIERALAGLLTVGDLLIYYQGFQSGQDYLRGFLRGIAKLYENSLFLSNLYELLALEPTVKEYSDPQPMPRPIKQGIVFNNVSFSYGSNDREVLHNINLSIRPGEVVALVGENGSGKTTLVKLLSRLYDVTKGTITIDGVPIQKIRVSDLRADYSVVFQDFVQYYLSVRENIWFGNIDLPRDSKRIITAAQEAEIDDMISQMSKGYDTVLGRWLDEGEEASGGNWQRLALARAFLRDSQILIMDEPTSAIDALAEEKIFEKIRQLAAGKTLIIISHRLSSVKLADAIHVLDGGKLIESGTHDELMARSGQYARMFNTQAQHYIPSGIAERSPWHEMSTISTHKQIAAPAS
ncbi:MAG: ABC transporter ATP-binding protein [Anaerolineae bacterium]|nr:ABC transporter ATP-binding protein [Anaerolineae bacterium]